MHDITRMIDIDKERMPTSFNQGKVYEYDKYGGDKFWVM